jgi:phosphoribosylanthranilate isomerase
MARTKIKVCGVTSVEDARLACLAGADAIGLNFYSESKRGLKVSEGSAIEVSLPTSVSKVGVFVNPSQRFVNKALEAISFDFLQFHGSESVSFCESFSVPYIKAIPAQNSQQIQQNLAEYSSASAILLDTKVGVRFGGTGEPFDWKIVPETKLPLIVAGGLNPQNVFEAVSLMRPFAVDVSSGVEKASIQKDFQMMREFIEQVHLADDTLNEKG